MENIEMKNILFLSDENTPYADEFSLMGDDEIADLIERRLFSNDYFCYTIHSVHKSKGIVTLIRDDCGHEIETTLAEIEDGILPEKCPVCRQAKKDMLIEFRDEIQEELQTRGLVAVLYETKEKTDSLYIECTKCGAKYYYDTDFKIFDEASEMYCKNWDCVMDAAVSDDYWIADEIKSGEIVIKDKYFSPPECSPFVQHYEDWFCDLGGINGYYERKCEKCNTINVLPLGKWECEACNYNGLYDCTIEKWDEFEDEVTVICDKCGSKYTLSCEDANEELFECFECFKRNLGKQKTCPICETEDKYRSYYCSTCGFPMDDIHNNTIKTQSQYTAWMKNTVYPSMCIWNTISPKYTKALNDLSASLRKETELLTKNKELNEKLTHCHTEASKLHDELIQYALKTANLYKTIAELNQQINKKNAIISEMYEKYKLT